VTSTDDPHRSEDDGTDRAEPETGRMAALSVLRLLDDPVDEAMSEVVRLAAEVCDVPTAVINILDEHRQHSFGPFAAEIPSVPRETSLCRDVVDSGTATAVDDLSQDERFADNPWVTGELAAVRFYASAPLITRSGMVVGTLCAFDVHAHHVGPLQLRMLQALADQVVTAVELRAAAREAAAQAQLIAEQAQQAAEVLETSSDAYLAWTPDGIVFGWNRASELLYGYYATEAMGRHLGELIVTAADRDAFRTNLAAGRYSPHSLRVTHLTKDRRPLTVDLVIWPSRSGPGWHAFARDVTELARKERERESAEAARRQAESLLTIAFDHAPNGTAILGVRGTDRHRLLRVNAALIALTRRDDLPSSALVDLLEDPGGEVLREFDRLADGERDEFETSCRLRSGGGHIIVQAVVALARDAEGRPEHAVAQLRDVTQQRAHELWLTQHATTDPLTGLPNRLAMRERLAEEIDALRSGEGAVAVMLLDLDGFKTVNDTLGHQAGDDVLCSVAEALMGVLPPDALAARLGGDEFVMVVPRHDQAQAEALARNVTAAVDDIGLELTGHLPRPVTGSVGVTTTANPATAPEELIQEADRAMYGVKKTRHPVPGTT
jgi:diguanylate cyclase (GGDEF)-like protein/PAS domain S-box-containing protein